MGQAGARTPSAHQRKQEAKCSTPERPGKMETETRGLERQIYSSFPESRLRHPLERTRLPPEGSERRTTSQGRMRHVTGARSQDASAGEGT